MLRRVEEGEVVLAVIMEAVIENNQKCWIHVRIKLVLEGSVVSYWEDGVLL